MSDIKVSIIIPVYNEARYVEENILGILECDFPKDSMEIIYIDGKSTDGTQEIIEKFSRQYPFIYWFTNDKRLTPYGLNIGISKAKGEFVIFAGAHSKFDKDYISELVNQIERLKADAVGGMIRTEVANINKESVSIKKVLSNKFGVGNATYRTGAKEVVESDTAGFLCYNREKLIEIGGYNEKLTRNQDIELNKRILRNGGKIYLIPHVHVTYFARETYREISKNNFQNGKWNILTVCYTKDFTSLSLRHFIPLIFILSLIAPSILAIWWHPFIWVTLSSFIAYNMLIITQSVLMNNENTSVWCLIKAFYTLHFSYGIGSIVGILKVIIKKF